MPEVVAPALGLTGVDGHPGPEPWWPSTATAAAPGATAGLRSRPMGDDHQHGGDDHGHQHGHQHSHGHQHGQHGHQHGHHNDQGWRGALRYLRWAPRMWRSDINEAVVGLVSPKPGERLLDVGAGMGAGAASAAARGATVVAVEPTPFLRRILVARRVLSRNRSKLVVTDGAAERLPATDASIDAIMAVNTMHHWTDHEVAAAEIARVLRPGGRLVLLDEVFTDPSHPDHHHFGDRHSPEAHGFSVVDGDEMTRLLTEAGMHEVEAGQRIVIGRPSIVVTGRR